MKQPSEQIITAVCDEIATLLTSKEADLTASMSQIGSLLEWVLENERQELPPDRVVGLRQAPTRAAAAPHLSPEELTAFLRERFDDENATTSSVSQVVGGFSKRTTRVLSHFHDAPQRLVLRQTVGADSDPSLESEFEVVQFAWANDLKVPEPLWIEPEVNRLGGPFFATRLVDGSNPGDVFGADQLVLPEIGSDLAGFLAQLHALNVGTLARLPTASMATSDNQLEQLLDAENRLRQATGEPGPLVSAVFDWLKSHLPPALERPVLVHGDVGFHNVLVENQSIAAVLDWERAHIGDPAEDLAYLRPTLKGVMDWPEFLTTYETAGGTLPSRESLQFYTVWQDVWRYVACEVLLTAYDSAPRLSSLFAGRIFGPHFLADAVNSTNT